MLLIACVGTYTLWQRSNYLRAMPQSSPSVAASVHKSATITLPGANPIVLADYDSSNPASLWVVVNKQRPISADYVPVDLTLPPVLTRADKTQEEQSVRQVIVKPLYEMFAEAQKNGLSPMVSSGYRSATLQKAYFDGYVQQGGIDYARSFSALSGTSEHQTGLAVDISTSDKRCYLEADCFISLLESQWLAQHAYQFGFILRYPNGKEGITGYHYEPWHYRYVGKDLADALFKSGLTLDEALPYIEKAAKQ